MTRNVESGAADANLGAIVTPQEFLTTTSTLTLEERRRIVDRALVLIEQFYVLLPSKRAMHAADPVQRPSCSSTASRRSPGDDSTTR